MSRSLEEFERLFRGLHRPVNTFFRNRGLRPEEAAELAQETFAQAYQAWPTYRGDASPKSWLFGIAKNLWRNHLRAAKRLKRAGEEVSVEALSEEGTEIAAAAIATDPVRAERGPLGQVLDQERDDAVRTAIAELPEEQRTPLFLQVQGLKYGEIAAALHIPVDAVKRLLFKARQQLKTRLERQFGKGGY